MSNRSETFGRLLKGAINSIAAYEGKTAPAIEDELGAQIGVAGSTIQRYKAGYLPTEPRVVQILAEAAVRRGYLSRAWLTRFLQAARYPTPDALVAQLADTLGPTGAPRDSALPSGMLAFLFTDIEGSTTLWEQHTAAMEHAVARHDTIMRQTIDAYGGQIFNTAGDAFHAAFTLAADALDAVLAAQRALAAEAWGPIAPLRVRAALHVGAAQQRDGDYYGPPLNRIARLCAAGHGGQVLLSNAAQELVRDALPQGAALRDLGEHRLKDLARPEHIFQVVVADLPADFPPLRVLDSYTHNLPAQATPLIGREAEVLAVCDPLRRENVRLLTLTGPGGIGKTRLALQAAADLLDDFRDGVYFVSLAPIHDPTLVLTAIAQALGVTEAAGSALEESVKAHLRSRHMLLVLDNFEHLATAGPLVAELLAAAPELKVMVSSREVLHLYGEHEYAVPPLSLPDLRRLPPLERLTQYEAVRLFIERAQAVRPDFAVTADNAPALAEVCVRLDGLPLAIELAAARSKLFSPKALLVRLDKRLALLTGGSRDLPARQQTLRNAIAWSYDLLDAAEQAIFARLGVFVGGCTWAAAEAVLADDQTGGDDLASYISGSVAIDGLTSLVDKSLLKQEDLEGEPRFVMLETIREYALEQLDASGETTILRHRHADYYLAFAETAAQGLNGAQQKHCLDRLEQEHDNLRAALAWTLDQREGETALKFCVVLREFWQNRGYFSEGLRWMDAALTLSHRLRLPLRAQALTEAGQLAFQQSDLARARALHEESLTLARDLRDPFTTAHALSGMGIIARKRGDLAGAQALYEESLTLFRELGDSEGISGSLFALGMVALRRGDTAQAWTLGQESLAGFRGSENALGIAHPLGLLGEVAALRGDYEQAAALLRESLTLARDVGGILAIALGLVRLAGGDTAKEHPVPMARLFGAMEALLDSLDVRMTPAQRAEWDRNVAALCGHLNPVVYLEAWERGRAMPLEQAIAEALAISGSSGRTR